MPHGANTEKTRIPGVYVWEPPGKPVSVRVSLDVVDRMLQDVMRGFGAVPKRGAEVGGILIGRAASGDRLVVDVDDYELVPIEYKRSPSYLFSEEDAGAFQAALQRLKDSPDPLRHPIGYFRSNTRDSVGLQDEDLELLRVHFPQREAVALLIKPYATRVSQAGFYFKENGKFQVGLPLLEFPFRRRDLEPDAAGKARRPEKPAPQLVARPARAEATASASAPFRPVPVQPSPETAAPAAITAPPELAPALEAIAAGLPLEIKSRGRGWLWAPLSFIFLLLGVLLGFQAALSMRPQLPPGSTDPYNLNVTVTKNGSNLQVKWDRQALAVRAAQKGLLTIRDGDFSKPVPLNAVDLQSGSVVYPPSTDHVTFRLDVIVSPQDTLTETVDWHQ